VGRPWSEFCEVDSLLCSTSLQNVEHFQNGKSLSVWRHLVDVITFVPCADGCLPGRLVPGEILQRHRATQCFGLGNDRLSDVALVESLATLLLQQSERPCQVRIAKDGVGGRDRKSVV